MEINAAHVALWLGTMNTLLTVLLLLTIFETYMEHKIFEKRLKRYEELLDKIEGLLGGPDVTDDFGTSTNTDSP